MIPYLQCSDLITLTDNNGTSYNAAVLIFEIQIIDSVSNQFRPIFERFMARTPELADMVVSTSNHINSDTLIQSLQSAGNYPIARVINGFSLTWNTMLNNTGIFEDYDSPFDDFMDDVFDENETLAQFFNLSNQFVTVMPQRRTESPNIIDAGNMNIMLANEQFTTQFETTMMETTMLQKGEDFDSVKDGFGNNAGSSKLDVLGLGIFAVGVALILSIFFGILCLRKKRGKARFAYQVYTNDGQYTTIV